MHWRLRCILCKIHADSWDLHRFTMIGPISGIVLFEVVYINKWSTPQEAASWLHEPASMYEVIPSKPISTEEFTAKQLQWECMKAIQAVSRSWVLIFLESGPGKPSLVGWLDWLWICIRSLIRAIVKTLRVNLGLVHAKTVRQREYWLSKGRIKISHQASSDQ